MNKTIIGAILVLALMILVSATTVSVMTVKPATPKEVFVDWYSLSTSLNSNIREKAKQGFIVKSVTANSQKSEYILGMEKY